MSVPIFDNKLGVVNHEKSSIQLLHHYLQKALDNELKITAFFLTNSTIFSALKSMIDLLLELDEKDLLSEIYILIGSETRRTVKDFLFYLKNDSIILNSEDYNKINNLVTKKKIHFRVNFDYDFYSHLYIFNIGDNLKIWTGSTDFSPSDTKHSLRLLSPLNISDPDKNDYLTLFKKIWNLSSGNITNISILSHLETFAQSEVINLSPRNFISSFLQLTEKQYLVKNISFDLSIVAEFQNMAFYSVIEKLNYYGGAVLLNSMGLSEKYVASMIIKFYQEHNHNSIIICSEESKSDWLQTFNKTGLKEENVTILNRVMFLKDELEKLEVENTKLIIVNEADFFSIRSDDNKRLINLKKLIDKNKDTQILYISHSVVKDSMLNFISLIKTFNHGYYKSFYKNTNYPKKITSLEKSLIEDKLTSKMLEELQFLFDKFAIKIEWQSIKEHLDDESIANYENEKPMITTVKYAYDHEISLKLYEKLVPFINSINFEYTKLFSGSYYDNIKFINWLKWKLYKKIESSINSFIETLRNVLDKCYFVKNLITDKNFVDMHTNLFSGEQIINIQNAFDKLDDNERKTVLTNLDADLKTIEEAIHNITSIRYLENKDDKITNLLKILKSENKPAIIFTESEETVYYIERRLKDYGNFLIELIVGGDPTIENEERFENSNTDIYKLSRDYDDGKFDIIISNDIIPDDITFQRAKIIINFDIPCDPNILNKRSRKALSTNTNKVKIYNFQSDKRIDKEINLFETMNSSLLDVCSYIGLDFIYWAKHQNDIDEVSEEKKQLLLYLTKEYKDYLVKKNPIEIDHKFIIPIETNNIILREFVKIFNISEETLKLTSVDFKKPVYTCFKHSKEDMVILYALNETLHLYNNIKFSDIRINQTLTNGKLLDVKSKLITYLEENSDLYKKNDKVEIIAIIEYKN